MEAYFSLLKYFPLINHDDGYAIGVVLCYNKGDSAISCNKFSTKRIDRINRAYGIKKSELVELTIKKYSAEAFDSKRLSYLSAYSNGSLRFSSPSLLISENMNSKIDELYDKYVADYLEIVPSFDDKYKKNNYNKIGSQFRNHLKENSTLTNRLDIGFDFKNTPVEKLMVGHTKIDFIGGNGAVFCGEVINLDGSDDTVERNFNKTITLFNALEQIYSVKSRFNPNDCKLLLLKSQVDKVENAEYMHIFHAWHKQADYSILIKNSVDDFAKEVQKFAQSKDVKPFSQWHNSVSAKLELEL